MKKKETDERADKWMKAQLNRVKCKRCRKVANILNELLPDLCTAERYLRNGKSTKRYLNKDRFLCKPISESFIILTQDIFPVGSDKSIIEET